MDSHRRRPQISSLISSARSRTLVAVDGRKSRKTKRGIKISHRGIKSEPPRSRRRPLAWRSRRSASQDAFWETSSPFLTRIGAFRLVGRLELELFIWNLKN